MNREKDIRIVLELKRDAITSIVINKLYQFSPLQSSLVLIMLPW